MQHFKNLFYKLLNHRRFFLAVLSVALCCSIGIASAFYTYSAVRKTLGLTTNNFIGEVSGKCIKNNTDRTVYARAYIVPYWKSTSGNGDEYVGLDEWSVDDKINSGDLVVNDTDWRKSGNYYYYKKTLAPGEKTSELINKFKGDGTFEYVRNEFYNPKILLANTLSNNTSNSLYTYPHLKIFDYTLRTETKVENFSGVDLSSLPSTYASGSGTVADPYIINNGDQLLKCVTSTGVSNNGAQLYFKLGADIYLNKQTAENVIEYSNQWVCSRDKKTRFCGVFDGNGYTVNGLYINYTNDSNAFFVNEYSNTKAFGGLFPCLGPGAVVKNLGILNSKIYNLPYSGAIAGYVAVLSENDKPVTIENCFVQNMSTDEFNRHTESDEDAVGGFVGYAEVSYTAENPLLYINNAHITARFDIWTVNNGSIVSPNERPLAYRAATVGNSNSPSKISVNNGYSYFTSENNTSAGTKSNWEEQIKAAPNGAHVTNFFTQIATCNMAQNYETIKTAFNAVLNDSETDSVWSFKPIDEESMYPDGGLLISSSTGNSTIAKQAYKVAFELLQYDGTTDSGNVPAVNDAWGSEVSSIVTNTDIETLKTEYNFYSAKEYAKMNGSIWTEQNVQPTLSGTNYNRYQPKFTDNCQSADSLTADGENLDKDNTPVMTFLVNAPVSGMYNVVPEFIANTYDDVFFLVSVNDKKYQRNNFARNATYNTENHVYYSANPVLLQLDAGVNVVRIIITKEMHSIYDVYSKWLNFNGIWATDGLEIKKPVNIGVEYRDVEGGEFNVRHSDQYACTSNEKCINNARSGGERANLITMENLNASNFENVPYSMFKIKNTGDAGYYDIELYYNTKAKVNSDSYNDDTFADGYIVTRVNGVNYRFNYKAYPAYNQYHGTLGSRLNITVRLNSGLNYITITAPLETSASDESTVPLLRYTSWFNQYSVYFCGYGNLEWVKDINITPEANDPDIANLTASHDNILQSETYGVTNRYAQIESAKNDTVVGGIAAKYITLPDWSAMPTDRFTERNELYYLDDSTSAHIDYYIYAPETKNYTIKPRSYFCFANDKYDSSCSFYIMINDSFKCIKVSENDLSRDSGGRFWYTKEITLPLKAGVNVFRIIPFDRMNNYVDTDGTTIKDHGAKWMNHDYIELLSDELIGVKPSSQYRGALQSSYVYGYYGADCTNGYNSGNGTFSNNADFFAAYTLGYIVRSSDLVNSPATYSANSLTLSKFTGYATTNKNTIGEGGGMSGISYTIKVPIDGYYSLTSALALENNNESLKDTVLSYVAFVNDGEGDNKYIIPFKNNSKDLSANRSDCSVYLKAGINTITFSCPVSTAFLTDSTAWCDWGSLQTNGGITFAPYRSRINPVEKWGGVTYYGGITWTDRLGA